MSGGIGGGEGEGFDLSVKGQIHGYDTAQAAVNVGADDQIIYADSAQAAGIGYGASAKSTLGTTGDILAASSANTLSAIAAGSTSGHVLTSTGAASLPTYQAAAGGGQMELLDTVTLGSAGANLTITPSSPYAAADYAYWIVKAGTGTVSGGQDLQFQINSSSAAVYGPNIIGLANGTLSGTTYSIQTQGTIFTSNIMQAGGETQQWIMWLELEEQNSTNTFRWNWQTTSAWDQGGLSPSDSESCCGQFGNNFQTQLSELDFFLSGGGDFTADSVLTLYGVKR